jgi:hypothetical protein
MCPCLSRWPIIRRLYQSQSEFYLHFTAILTLKLYLYIDLDIKSVLRYLFGWTHYGVVSDAIILAQTEDQIIPESEWE